MEPLWLPELVVITTAARFDPVWGWEQQLAFRRADGAWSDPHQNRYGPMSSREMLDTMVAAISAELAKA